MEIGSTHTTLGVISAVVAPPIHPSPAIHLSNKNTVVRPLPIVQTVETKNMVVRKRKLTLEIHAKGDPGQPWRANYSELAAQH